MPVLRELRSCVPRARALATLLAANTGYCIVGLAAGTVIDSQKTTRA